MSIFCPSSHELHMLVLLIPRNFHTAQPARSLSTWDTHFTDDAGGGLDKVKLLGWRDELQHLKVGVLFRGIFSFLLCYQVCV